MPKSPPQNLYIKPYNQETAGNRCLSALRKTLPQMQAKRQELVTWDHGPPARKTLYMYIDAGRENLNQYKYNVT